MIGVGPGEGPARALRVDARVEDVDEEAEAVRRREKAGAQERGHEFKILTVFGQTALFFYMLHFYVLVAAALATHTMQKLGIPGALLGAALLVMAMYPLCRWYQGYKRRRDNWFTRYV